MPVVFRSENVNAKEHLEDLGVVKIENKIC
jgi:hypothetical protein